VKQSVFALIAAAALIGCGPKSDSNGNSDGGDDDCGTCPDDKVCVQGECRECLPGGLYCAGPGDNQVWECNADGTGGSSVEQCNVGDVCQNGTCLTPCEAAEQNPSNVGCNFYAVDLDNEAVGGLISNDAAAQQFAVAVANTNEYPVRVDVYKNVAKVGQPVQEELVTTVSVPSMDLVQIDLPQREVDGTMGPVVAYQFQPVVQQFSNDASILIPRQALGERYVVLGWPTSNPCGAPPGDPLYQESIPDHTAVTIVGIEPDTHITVIPTHPITNSTGDSGINIMKTAAGVPLDMTIGQYDVVNLESDQPQVSITQCLNFLDRDGDFTGTIVTSDKPIAVFSNLERGSGVGGADVAEPPGWDGTTCCTDHLEQQMFPVGALGWQFAVSRSPVRSTSSTYVEPDIYRVLATENNTPITTNLPAPDNSFTLNAGEFRTFPSYEGFTVKSDGGAIMVGQYLVSQGLIPEGGIGDPTFVVFPAAEQHRKEYVFLVPTTFSKNYMVLSMPEGATVTIDGQALPEFGSTCVTAPVGNLDGIEYIQMTCEMTEGVHSVASDEALGLTVYGYYNVGSYGYPGGSDVKLINPIN
jgi:hypothetical protein